MLDLRAGERRCNRQGGLLSVYGEGAVLEGKVDSRAVLAVGEVQAQGDLQGAGGVDLIAAGGAAALHDIKQLLHLGEGVALFLRG